jgi:rSAM/selenodomain-associated transferase 1
MSSSRPTSQNSQYAPPRGTLVIMAKAPRPGTVKTRLIRDLPVDQVTDFYHCLLDDTIALARSLDGIEVTLLCPEADAEELRDATRNIVPVVPQTGIGLEAGLDSVFHRFSQQNRRPVVAFNSDTPHLPASILDDAFRALVDHDVVLGPTHDGGYYLVGATAPHPGLFASDAMGTTNALESVLAHANAMNLSVQFTVRFYDIDEAADLHRLADELQHHPDRAPKTAAWLRAWNNEKIRAAESGSEK